MPRNDFAVFILSHGRANRVYTHKLLQNFGYTGKYYIVLDDQDTTADDYRKRFGDRVVVFDKLKAAEITDTMDNEPHQRGVVFARNYCWTIAKELGLDYFMVLDDDYTNIQHITNERHNSQDKTILCRNLDRLFEAMVDFVENTPVHTLAMGQGGDYAGGQGWEKPKRKAMNSFVCATDRPFRFNGRINEDVNAYVTLGCQGKIFLSQMKTSVVQKITQTNPGGLTELYLDSGTYVKSFFSVVCHPSAVKVSVLRGQRHQRLHHRVDWSKTAPKIISEEYRKCH